MLTWFLVPTAGLKLPTQLCTAYWVWTFRASWEERGDGGHEQLISNGGRIKPVFADRDKKPTMIDLREISTNRFKNQLCPYIRLSRRRAQD
jgi:hypothetical protein